MDYICKNLCIEGDDVLINAVNKGTQKPVAGEIRFLYPEEKYYYVNVRPITGIRGDIIGRIVTFNDIMEYKLLISQINQKNGELEALNEELIEYSSTIEELAVVKECNRFARDVHDTVGHKITLLIALLRVLKISLGSDPETSRKKVDEAVNVAKESLQDLRGSIAGLVYNEKVSENLKESILRLVDNFKRSGVEIEVSFDGVSMINGRKHSEAVYRTIQEALTNS